MSHITSCFWISKFCQTKNKIFTQKPPFSSEKFVRQEDSSSQKIPLASEKMSDMAKNFSYMLCLWFSYLSLLSLNVWMSWILPKLLCLSVWYYFYLMYRKLHLRNARKSRTLIFGTHFFWLGHSFCKGVCPRTHFLQFLVQTLAEDAHRLIFGTQPCVNR